MITRRARIIFTLICALTMLVFNLRYCQEVQTAERARFEGWVGSLSPRTLPSDIQIEYKSSDGVRVFSATDDNSRANALRLIQVLKESGMVGRLGEGFDATRSVKVRVSPELEYSVEFSDTEARRSPQLQVFARLMDEFAPLSPPPVASNADSR